MPPARRWPCNHIGGRTCVGHAVPCPRAHVAEPLAHKAARAFIVGGRVGRRGLVLRSGGQRRRERAIDGKVLVARAPLGADQRRHVGDHHNADVIEIIRLEILFI